VKKGGIIMDSKKPSEKNLPFRWSELSYAGEKRVPIGIEPNADSWPTYYLLRDEKGRFVYPNGSPINFEITVPENINFNEQLDKVKKILYNLDSKQIAKAKYWGEGPATKQWTPIIDRLIDTYGQLDAPQENPLKAARILAAVQAGINDAFVVTWYFKYLWDIPRPNQLDQNLATIVCTPKFPSYPSGHAVMSGCTEVILSYFFPTEEEKLRKFAEENAMSRVYGGVHYPVDGEEGLRLGRQIGGFIVCTLKRQYDKDQAMIDRPMKIDLNADLVPPPYKQVIPYPRTGGCDSRIV